MQKKKHLEGEKPFESLLHGLGQVPKTELDAEIRKYEATKKRRKAKRQSGHKA